MPGAMARTASEHCGPPAADNAIWGCYLAVDAPMAPCRRCFRSNGAIAAIETGKVAARVGRVATETVGRDCKHCQT